MGSGRMALMSLSAGKDWRHRRRDWACGCKGEERGGRAEKAALIYIRVRCVCPVTQSCPTLCDPMDCRPPGLSVYGVLQARVVEWVPTSSSRGSSRPRD